MVVLTTAWATVTTVTTLFVATTTGQQQQQQQAPSYASRYDHLDITTILNNRRMVTYYANCLISKGPCPPQGLELKHILPEALETNCARCTAKQKTGAYRSIKRLKKEYPKIWDQLKAVWDPDGFYINRFETTFENEQLSNNEIQQRPSAAAAPAPPTVLSNRFGDDTAEATNNIATNLPPVPTTSTTSTTSTTRTTPTNTATSTSTNKPSTNTVIKPTQVPPSRQPAGANLQPTVSFGANAVVNGIVRSLTDLSVRVVQTGTKLADAVINAVIRPPVVN